MKRNFGAGFDLSKGKETTCFGFEYEDVSSVHWTIGASYDRFDPFSIQTCIQEFVASCDLDNISQKYSIAGQKDLLVSIRYMCFAYMVCLWTLHLGAASVWQFPILRWWLEKFQGGLLWIFFEHNCC